MAQPVLSDGRDAVSLAVVKQADARMSKLKEELDKQLRQFRRDYPDVETMRKKARESLDEGMGYALKYSLMKLSSKCSLPSITGVCVVNTVD